MDDGELPEGGGWSNHGGCKKTDFFFFLFKSIGTFLSRQMFHSTMVVGMWLEAGGQTTLFFLNVLF